MHAEYAYLTLPLDADTPVLQPVDHAELARLLLAGADLVPADLDAIGLVADAAIAGYSTNLGLREMARAARLPATNLTRVFQRAFGYSPMRWLWAFRTLLAAEIIAAAPHWSLVDIADSCGFASQAHFSRRFRAIFQEPPRHFQGHFRAEEAAKEATIAAAMAAQAAGTPVTQPLPKLRPKLPLRYLPDLGRRLCERVLAKLYRRGLRC